MDDLISDLPDGLICLILSFLLTKQAIATSVLSKRWKTLWYSVPTLDFEDFHYNSGSFVQSVNAFIHSRLLHQHIQKFRLRFISHYDDSTITEWVNVAVQRGVQHLDLSIFYHFFHRQLLPTNLSAIFTCNTLVVLKLQLEFKLFTSVDLPFLKVLHLQDLSFSERGYLGQLLSGCPALEDFKARGLFFNNYSTDSEFETLPKLVSADISMENKCFFLIEVVNNVEFLRIHKMDYIGKGTYVFPKFHNLTHIELIYHNCVNDWLKVVELLKHCPKLQVLVIHQLHLFDQFQDEEVVGEWEYLPCVPECTQLCLKRCYINSYRGTIDEFQLARYIMQNDRSLKRITICSDFHATEWAKVRMSAKLSSCMRWNAIWKLSFKY